MAGLKHSGTSRPDVLARMRDLDHRKAAAAKPLQEAKLARKRELTRESVRRSRMKGVQVTTLQDTKCEPDRAKQFAEIFGQNQEVRPNPIRQDLLRLSRDRKAPASARVTALRTLAEMDGLVGKLQTVANETADQPIATMSRAQLERELARLRALRDA